jgi:hypothetical protein
MSFEFDTSTLILIVALVVFIPLWLVVKSIKLVITLAMAVAVAGLAYYFLV